jgi:tRNA pseudouridine32 synthase/23S rRNA pseudouridine746 synthase
VDANVTSLDPPGELPARMPSPFAPGPPCEVARRAMERLRAELPAHIRASVAGDGKMFGVLVVEQHGRIGFLRAFSGMIGRTWHVPGFVPPTFDEAARDAFWIPGEAALTALGEQIAALDAQIAPLRHQMEALHADRDARAIVEEQMKALRRQRTALDEDRTARSRDFLVRIYATYSLPNARGEARPMRELFAPAEPPGGSGDCAAPKLLAYAYRHGLRPIALAEQWIGKSPSTGDRVDGVYYPACRGKCGPILAHMLDGLDVDPAPQFGGGPVAADEPQTLYEDDWLVIVDKPVGLLSVPGRGGALRDSVVSRLRERYPAATGPIVVHRLDLDTSGVLLAAKDLETHKALQRLFSIRAVDKRYVAWLDGEIERESGTIELPLRVDIDDRPRQIVDPIHGKPAITDWQVLARAPGRTRVALTPRTGRAHQLRVHMAVGLEAPIVGDRLYGRSNMEQSGRLLLHAEAIGFVHPHTAQRLAVTRPAPF